MILFLLAYLGGALTIVSPCILPVLPFVFARADRSFARGGLPLLAGMAATFAVVATLAAIGGGWAVEANQYGRIAALALLALFGVTLLFPALSDRMMRPVVALGARLSRSAEQGATEGGSSILPSLLLGVATGLLWAPCAGPLLGLILTGAALRGASIQTSLLLTAYAAGAATSLALALLAGGRNLSRDEAFARDRRMGTAGSGRRDSHCGRRDRVGPRHRLSHPRVPRKHGFARTRLARQIPFRGGHPTTAVRDHVRRPPAPIPP